MSQYLQQIPRQALQQQQRLTPQQIQSLNILQLGALALESQIQQEIDSNPALELAPSDEPAESPADDAPDIDADAERPLVIDEQSGEREFERFSSMVREYDLLEDDYGMRRSRSAAQLSEDGDVKMEAMSNAPSRGLSLQEHLLEQWALADVDARTRVLGEAIIEFVAENGRLEAPLDEIARSMAEPATLAEMEAALRRVQELEPPGVAARSLREALLLQLEAMPGENELERRIVAHHFEDLQKNRLPAIASAMGVELDEVKAAIQVISRLSMHPGAELVERRAPLIVPDILVDYNEERDEYEVRLHRSSTRELRISDEFRAQLEASRDDKGAREFMKDKIEAAKSLIDAVRFRRERLLDVAKCVVQAQRDFLDNGEQHLKVLRMSDLALQLNCDPSTISRTVDEKYMQTPRGIYPLRRFFTGGAETDNGEAIGWDSIKAKVNEIVQGEDKRNPLNDDEIVERLKAQGIEIKRRTVAKYRQQLDIPTARQRRTY